MNKLFLSSYFSQVAELLLPLLSKSSKELKIGLIDFLILPHYGEPKYEKRFQRIINKWTKRKYRIQALTNNQAIILKDYEMKIVSV